jgi:hypothetical protein
MTGTGSVMMSASPTTTGTLTAAAIIASGLVAMAGAATVGTTLGVTGTATMAAINASGAFTGTTGAFTKAAAGDVLVLTNGGATPKPMYFYSDASTMSMGTSASQGGSLLAFVGTTSAQINISGGSVQSWTTTGTTISGKIAIVAAFNSASYLDMSVSVANDFVAAFNNTSATPYSQYWKHSTDSNGAGNYFLECRGNATDRLFIYSNGGIANFSANNVNLSDKTVKSDFIPMMQGP